MSGVRGWVVMEGGRNVHRIAKKFGGSRNSSEFLSVKCGLAKISGGEVTLYLGLDQCGLCTGLYDPARGGPCVEPLSTSELQCYTRS